MKIYRLKREDKQKGGRNLQKKLKQDKKLREKRIKAINKAYKNPDYRKKLSKAQSRRFQKRKEKEKISISLTNFWKSPEERKQASEKAIEIYKNHPSLRQEARRRFISFLIKNKNALKYIEQGKGNKLKLSRVTKNKEKVRSLSELIIANYLNKNKIQYEYEAKQLVFPNFQKLGIVFAVPDFFLPEYNCIIEFYGQYPGSRERTTKKNNAYRYYKIPFLAITPSNLNNLNKIIPKFLKKTGKNPKLSRKARKIMWGTLD